MSQNKDIAGVPKKWEPSDTLPSPAHLPWSAHGVLQQLPGNKQQPPRSQEQLEVELDLLAHYLGKSEATEPWAEQKGQGKQAVLSVCLFARMA